jgi:hypothetical protein
MLLVGKYGVGLMTQKRASRLTACVVLLLAILIALSVVALGQTRKPAKSPPKPVAPATAKKASGETACDGALDIVPSQPMTFSRKRRPKVPETKAPRSSSLTSRNSFSE